MSVATQLGPAAAGGMATARRLTVQYKATTDRNQVPASLHFGPELRGPEGEPSGHEEDQRAHVGGGGEQYQAGPAAAGAEDDAGNGDADEAGDGGDAVARGTLGGDAT